MHIAVDGGTWANRRGYGRFTREILTAAAARSGRHTFSLVVESSVPRDDMPPALRIVPVRLETAPSVAAGATSRRSLRDLWRMSRAMAAEPADRLFFPASYTYVPVATRKPVVVCIHDVIAERFPDHVFASRRARWFWTLKTRAAIAQAARVVTVSDHARAGLIDVLRVPSERIRVVGEAPAAVFSPAIDLTDGRAALDDAGLPGESRFLLYVGGIAPHKNLQGLVEALMELRRRPEWQDLLLLIVGDYRRDVFLSAYPAIRSLVERHASHAVRFLGALSDSAVAGLMQLSQAVVLPSFDEGFGLPGIEAAACGAAVVATVNSALPEILGDAAIYFDPAQPGGLTAALETVLGGPGVRDDLRIRAAARAASCTWEAAADRLLAVFDEMAR